MTATPDDVDPIAVALVVTRVLDALVIANTVGGSIASSYAGEPRSTVDIDIVAALQASHVPALAAALSDAFYLDEDAVRRAVRERSSTNLVHRASMLKVDLFVAGGTPLDAQQIARRRPVRVGEGATFGVHPPEDILLQKLRWYRLGGEVSDRQWRDVRGIIRVQGAGLDVAYLRENAPILGVGDLLERALEQDG
jgi:hypothetical protein